LISLKVPLTAEQLDAATRLHVRLVSWKATDAALDLLAKRIPEFDFGACLIKASAVNQLYGTNVYALNRVCAHVSDVMKSPDADDLVERIATFREGEKTKHYVSFASKFAHFFIDKDAYPVFDSYALQGLRHHLAGVRFPTDGSPPYADYVAGLASLKTLASLSCSGRELDRYLWLSGLYRAWSNNPKAPINLEARSVFDRKSEDPAINDELRVLSADRERE